MLVTAHEERHRKGQMAVQIVATEVRLDTNDTCSLTDIAAAVRRLTIVAKVEERETGVRVTFQDIMSLDDLHRWFDHMSDMVRGIKAVHNREALQPVAAPRRNKWSGVPARLRATS